MTQRSSAYSVAAIRAASWLSHSHVRHDDYLARYLLPWHLRLTVEVPPLRRVVVGFFDRYIRGLYGTHLARTRAFDLAIASALNEGTRQLVVLGAGLDSRAFRLAAKYGARTWELDLPANQQTKRRVLARQNLNAPQVTYLASDLASEDWPAALKASGFDAHQPTVWLLEGVSMYLDRPVFESVLAAISSLSAPKSSFHFDFYAQDAFDHPERYPGAQRHFQFMARRGEPYRLGLDPERLSTLAGEHGFSLSDHLSPYTLDARFLTDEAGAFVCRSFGFLHLAHFRLEA